MATKSGTKATGTKATGKAVVPSDAVKPDAVEPAEVVSARQAMVAAADVLANTERSAEEAILAATRTFGTSVLAYCQAVERAAGRTVVGLTDWSAVRKVLAPNGAKVGTVTVGNRSEATVQRAVKVAMYFPNDAAVKAYDETKAAVLAKATKPNATDAAKAIAKHAAYSTNGIKALVTFGEAKATKRLTVATGAIRAGRGKGKTAEVIARTDRADAALGAVDVIDDKTAEPDVRQTAGERVVVPGITVAMLHALSAEDLHVLAKVAGDMAKAKAKATPAKADPVPPVLETTAPIAPSVPASPLAGIDPATLALAQALLAAQAAQAAQA